MPFVVVFQKRSLNAQPGRCPGAVHYAQKEPMRVIKLMIFPFSSTSGLCASQTVRPLALSPTIPLHQDSFLSNRLLWRLAATHLGRCFSCGSSQHTDGLDRGVDRSDDTKGEKTDVKRFLRPCSGSTLQVQHGWVDEAQWNTMKATC